MLPQFDAYLQLIEKLCFIAGAVMYAIFAFVVVKQVSMQTKNVKDKFNGILIAFSWIHLIFAVLLVVLTLFL